MARVIYGGGVDELIGSIGGVTFQRNASGCIARLKPNMPVNPSPGQALQEYYLSQLVSSWSLLSISDKGSWDTFAAAHTHFKPWGEEKTLNGFQWYVSCNLNLLITAQATIATAPAWTSVPVVQAWTFTIDSTHLTLTFSPSFSFTGYSLMAYATHPLRQNSLKLRRSVLFILRRTTTPVTSFHLLTAYESVFKVVWADLFASAECTIIVHCKLIQNATGLAGTYTSQSFKLN
jgi:hypothetical protein